MAEIIDGKKIARAIQDEITARVARLAGSPGGNAPTLVTVVVGDDPAGSAYLNSQARTAAKLGLHFLVKNLSTETSQASLESTIEILAADLNVDGIMMQTPLPSGLDLRSARAKIPGAKDVEALTMEAAGALFLNQALAAPCTAMAAFLCLKSALPQLAGRHVVVVGRSDIVGRPAALLALHADATVTVAHSKTTHLADHLLRADAVIACAGRPGLIRGTDLRPGVVVVDVGTHVVPDGSGGTRLIGDVDYASAFPVASAITPVPGGVGPVTVAVLMRNLVQLAENRRKAAP